jgi:inosose dehydratase
MLAIRIGNAPCSWGILEFEDQPGDPAGYATVLDEIRETGYAGTELGDWGFMPTEPAALRAELEGRALAMIGAFVPVALKEPDAHAAGEAQAVRTARLQAAVADPVREDDGPFIVLADDSGRDLVRTKQAGRVSPEIGLTAPEWDVFARGAERVARAVRDQTGLRTVFHPHCAGYVETPAEIARFLELTDPALLGLVLDTGHLAYGSGGTDPAVVTEALDRFGDRIRHVHFKDCEPRVAAQLRAAGADYFEAVRRGVFCELGKGLVDFPAVVAWLRARDYRGWIVVEQDVLPGMGTPLESARRNREYLASIGL